MHIPTSLRRLLVLITSGMLVASALAIPAHAVAGTDLPRWKLLDSGSAEHFRGLAAVSSKVAWLGGYDGTVLRTVDGGRTWTNVSPAGAHKMQFRDISAPDATHAVAMAAGPGGASRIYVTSDRGASWQLAYKNSDPEAFFDCMSFYNRQHGLVLSDPVHGRFRILATHNGGSTWQVLPAGGMPAARPGEFGLAASGECLTTLGPRRVVRRRRRADLTQSTTLVTAAGTGRPPAHRSSAGRARGSSGSPSAPATSALRSAGTSRDPAPRRRWPRTPTARRAPGSAPRRCRTATARACRSNPPTPARCCRWG